MVYTIMFAMLFNLGGQKDQNNKYVNFTLRNGSLKSIYLKIPGVMNPNLSPMSNSGVSLKVGQKIFFFVDKKRYLLLEVDENLEGKTVMVNELIKERKKELGVSLEMPKQKGAIPYFTYADEERKAEGLGKLVWLPHKPVA